MFLFKRGIATQYREVQGHESKKFLSYFPKGIRYMEGGVATGLTKVENQHNKSSKTFQNDRNIHFISRPI